MIRAEKKTTLMVCCEGVTCGMQIHCACGFQASERAKRDKIFKFFFAILLSVFVNWNDTFNEC